MSELVFRRATAGDVSSIVSLLVDDELGKLRDDPNDHTYAVAFEIIDADPNQLLAVAEVAGRIAACLQITFIPGLSRRGAMRGQIEAVRVASNLRSKGIGTQFIQWAITKCRERNCALIQLTTDKKRADAHRFYERMGFSATHEGMKLMLR